MPLTIDECNNIANAEASRLTWLSAHTGDPGTTGANETTGPDYQRQQITWNAASNGFATAQQEAFGVLGGDYTHYGFWDAQSGGNFLGGDPLDAVSTLQAPGTLRITPNLDIASALAGG
jgi:hypothetical protein